MMSFGDGPYAGREYLLFIGEIRQTLHRTNQQLAELRFNMRDLRRQGDQPTLADRTLEKILSSQARTLHQQYDLHRKK